MDIKKQIHALTELFKIDSKLLGIKNNEKKLSKFFKDIKVNIVLIKDKSANFEKIKIKKIKENKKWNEILISERVKLKKWKERLSRIKNEREYSALMLEIHNQKKIIIEIKGNISKIKKIIEKSGFELKKCSEELIKVNSLSTKENLEKKKNIVSLEIIRNKIHEDKEIVLNKLDELVLVRYKKIFKHKDGCAISYILNDVCQGCMRYIPPALSQKIGLYESVECCPSCCRLLLVEQN